MLYIYIELRYQRQLSRVCPEVLDAFLSETSSAVKKNGGSVSLSAGKTLCCFDHASVGYAFSTARAISSIHDLLEKNRTRIREYFIIVDHSDAAVPPDMIQDSVSSYDSLITPDEGIMITAAAGKILSPYMRTMPLEGTELSLYTGSRSLKDETAVVGETADKTPLSLYCDFTDDPVIAFRNMILSSGLMADPGQLSGEEQSLFVETENALVMYCSNRFSRAQSEYRASACVDHFLLFFRTIFTREHLPVAIDVFGECPTSPEFGKLFDKLAAVCSFTKKERAPSRATELSDVPSDLLELTWLVYRCVKHLGSDDIVLFFSFIGKKEDFIADLGLWMKSCGLLSDPLDLRSVYPRFLEETASRLGPRKQDLDIQFARFLWKQYEAGQIIATCAFSDILSSLSFDPPDAFRVCCLYHEPNILASFAVMKDCFRSAKVADAIDKTERAWKAYEAGDIDTASSITRDVLGVFQGEKIVAGEYRVLTLIALLSLAKGNGDDAIVYFEYALENAEAMHDQQSMLSTRFDMALVFFTLGNFHFAVCSLEAVDRIVEKRYAKDWEVLVLFMKGRIAFDLGDYRNAELYFQTAASLATVYQIPESISLCRVWYARSLVLQGRYSTGDDILLECASVIPEAWAFLLESGLLSGRRKDHPFPESIASPSTQDERWSAGRLVWKSGFSMAEDRCNARKADFRVAVMLYEVFLLCYRSRFSEGEDQKDIAKRLAVCAGKAAAQKDPYAGIYYYFAYDQTVRTSVALSADSDSCLSRAFKYMQKRANEIDDNNMREQYMQTPVWNSRLYRAARDNMLI